MSLKSKIFFGASCVAGVGTVFMVHYLQIAERETMFAGVLRDDERLAAKKVQRAREAEFEEQARKRAFLQGVSAVSNPSVPPPALKGEAPTAEEGATMDFSCKTCEKEV